MENKGVSGLLLLSCLNIKVSTVLCNTFVNGLLCIGIELIVIGIQGTGETLSREIIG